MKNPIKLSVAHRVMAAFAGVLIPVSLILSIPEFFKTERVQKQEKPPIIIEMVALQSPQQKPTKSVEKVKPKPRPVKKQKTVKPKTAKKSPAPNPVKKKIPKKTILVKQKPEIKEIPQPKEIPLEKSVDKIAKEIPKKIIAKRQIELILPIPVPIFKLTEAPQFLHKEEMIYPEAMRSSGKTGVVKVAVLIGKEGKVHRVTVLKSAGQAFDEAAKKSMLASTFVPAKMGNKAVAVELRMPIIFRLL